MIDPIIINLRPPLLLSDERYTPPWIFERLDTTFDIDVASPHNPVPWIPSLNHLTYHDDGLTHEWYGKVWMNPPFSNVQPWIKRFIEHGNGIALIPLAKSRWLDTVWKHVDGITIITRKLSWFIDNVGMKRETSSACCLIAMGSHNVQNLKNIAPVR